MITYVHRFNPNVSMLPLRYFKFVIAMEHPILLHEKHHWVMTSIQKSVWIC